MTVNNTLYHANSSDSEIPHNYKKTEESGEASLQVTIVWENLLKQQGKD
jgi:hypothetical protein